MPRVAAERAVPTRMLLFGDLRPGCPERVRAVTSRCDVSQEEFAATITRALSKSIGGSRRRAGKDALAVTETRGTTVDWFLTDRGKPPAQRVLVNCTDERTNA